MDISKISNPEAKRFFDNFFQNREINREFYSRVPEENFDFRMVDIPERKSDSPRESLAHQVDTTRDYVNGVKSGILKFGPKYEDLKEPSKLSKEQLMKMLVKAEEALFEILRDPKIGNKKVKVPWNSDPIPAIASLWGMNSHEILHTGWNLAIMDHLNIERFPKLKAMWG